MKLYDGGRAPNPRRVRIFLVEKGMTCERGHSGGKRRKKQHLRPQLRGVLSL
jgi:glutathione S-transferase